MKPFLAHLFGLALSCAPVGAAHAQAKAPASSIAQVNQEIAALRAQPELRGASLGIYVAPATGGPALLSLNENLSLAPASVFKLFTTGAALSLLGGGYQFRTYLEYSGQIDPAGTLQGDLYVRGGGDPSLAADEPEKLLAEWVGLVQKAGIKKINGAVVADGSLLSADHTPGSWAWVDLANYYGAGASGLSYRHNQVDVVFRPGTKPGQPTQLLRTDPPVPGLRLINEVRTGEPGSGDQAYLYGGPYTYHRYVRGTLPPGSREFRVRGALPDAEWQLAHELAQALLRKGMTCTKSPTTVRLLASQGQTAPRQRKVLSFRLSPPLRELVKTTNVKSFNLYAESFFRFLGYHQHGSGTTEHGAKAVTEFWQAKGLATPGLFMEDGSGLSRFNAATPWQVGQVLRIMRAQPTFSDFYFSLPVVGKTGTVAKFAKNTPAANNARLKSGYLTRVKTYAGYLDLASGQRLLLVLMVNNYAGEDELMTQRLEKIVGMLAALKTN
jgi:serine-type D-Ala-D-Ala carboxypeptidase/endopeptidase (penicillin-binding protein 4)